MIIVLLATTKLLNIYIIAIDIHITIIDNNIYYSIDIVSKIINIIEIIVMIDAIISIDNKVLLGLNLMI